MATAVIEAREEDLHSVFRTRTELLGWSQTASAGRPDLLWNMYEAELVPLWDRYTRKEAELDQHLEHPA